MRRADHYGPSLGRTFGPGQAAHTSAVTLPYVAALASSAAAIGLGLGLFEVAAAYLAGAALASAVPTPSGLGATEAALAASLVAVGATIGPAVAAVLAFRWSPSGCRSCRARWPCTGCGAGRACEQPELALSGQTGVGTFGRRALSAAAGQEGGGEWTRPVPCQWRSWRRSVGELRQDRFHDRSAPVGVTS